MIETAYAAPEYDDEAICFLETMWGEGYLSPGGPEEVDRVIEGVQLAGRNVLDVGCGIGGITMYLAGKHADCLATGFDVEQPVIEIARLRAHKRGLSDRVSFIHAEPGRLPFPDRSFDVVFSKDALLHVSDKDRIFADIFRVLKPGGIVAASDWMISHGGEPSPEMRDYIASEGLTFNIASSACYAEAMRRAGFQRVTMQDRNEWYREVARGALASLKGPLYEKVAAAVGPAYVEKSIRIWETKQRVLDTGELRPTHIRAHKPSTTDHK